MLSSQRTSDEILEELFNSDSLNMSSLEELLNAIDEDEDEDEDEVVAVIHIIIP
jgi:glutamine phosphoribosylpyrophosphate amidotransferase